MAQEKLRVSFGTFSLAVDKGWTLSSVVLAGPPEKTSTQGLMTAKPAQSFQRNLITTMEQVDNKTTLQSYLKEQIKSLREAGVQPEGTKAPESVKTEGGDDGMLTEHVLLGPGGERVRQMQLIVIKNGIAHTSVASHLDGKAFEAARKEFRDILLSFN